MDDILNDFLAEAGEALAAVETELVRLEQDPARTDGLDSIFRAVHTIKGTCGFLALPRLETLTHAAETVLAHLRDGKAQATPALVTLILAAFDQVKALLAHLDQEGQELAGDDQDMVAQLLAAAETPGTPAVAPPSAPPPIATQPPPDAAAPAEPAPVMADPPVPQDRAGLRVSMEVIEKLMALAGELVLNRNQLLDLLRQTENSPFEAPLHRLSALASDLQEQVVATRMQPIGQAWQTLPRVIRDLNLDLGKTITLTMSGDDTELDRQVLDMIRDPLIHMVRNAADHGLETPAERRAAGKPETASLRLKARHEGGQVLIEIADDGRGLNRARIRARALERGLTSEMALADMPPEHIDHFIFTPGFSTAQTVSTLSGRGVGLDVVRANVERLGGVIAVTSEPGAGTVFTIRIPLTLAIVSMLIVTLAGRKLALPQSCVSELVRLTADGPAQLETVGGAGLLRLRGHVLPVLPLHADLGLPALETGGCALVLDTGGSRFAVLVDQALDTEETVVKPLPRLLIGCELYAGVTILGDGGVLLILDPSALARRAGSRAPVEPPAPPPRAPAQTTDLLLFRAGTDAVKAVPLAAVARLEDVASETLQRAQDTVLVPYGGTLLPVVTTDPSQVLRPSGHQPLIVVSDAGRLLALAVDEILDSVQDTITIEHAPTRPGLLGVATIAGRATEILDLAHSLRKIYPEPADDGSSVRPHVLMVDDSAIFRELTGPLLEAAGYAFTAAESVVQAWRLRDQGLNPDIIISDIDMPETDGFAFARALRRDPTWCSIPRVALSSLWSPDRRRRGLEAGFQHYVAKGDQQVLLDTLATVTGRGRQAA